MTTCPVNDWTCPCFDSEGGGKCKLPAEDGHLKCEFLSSVSNSVSEPEHNLPDTALGGEIIRCLFRHIEKG